MHLNPQTAHVQLNSRDPQFYQNPYPVYARLQKEAPVFYWTEHKRWTFVRHADVTGILRDRRFGRQITHILSREALGWPPERAELKPFLDVDSVSLLDLEPPDHTRLRGLIQKAFMARQIAQLAPRIAALAHRLIDNMLEQGQTDLLPAFATPIPVTVIAEFLGVPTTMNQQLLDWSHAMVKMYELSRTPEMEQAAVQAAVEFVAFLRDFITHKRQNLADDLISNLIQVEEAGDKLAENEMITTCILLLNAGHEATVNVIGNGVLALLQNPEQLAQWRGDAGVAKTAVEELLRYDTPLHLFNRYVLEDLDWNGLPLKQGEQVSLILGAANRDPLAFAKPQRLLLDRRLNPHLSFGGGIHYCLGAPLARLELQTALPILLQRLPNLQLTATPSFQNSYHFRGLVALPIRW